MEPNEVPAPTTHEEVKELLSTVPPEKEILDSVRVQFAPKRKEFWRNVSVAMFLLILLISQVTILQTKNDAVAIARGNGQRSQCRDEITGEINIAKAKGIQAGNTYNDVLGQALVLAVNRQAQDPTLGEKLDHARQALADTSLQIERAIQRQQDVLNICKDG